MYLGSWKIDDYLTFGCNTHRFDTGAATDADSVPTYRIYEDETAVAIITGSTALLDSVNTAGFYSERVQLTAVAGLEKGKTYTIYISATVNSIEGTMSHTFQIEAEVDANIVSDKTGFGLAADQSGVTVGTVTTTTTATNLTNAATNGDLTATMKTSVNTEADTALSDINLNHLMKTATVGADMTAEVVDNTVLSRILANGDTSLFVPSTDGFQPIRDQGDSSWITAVGFSTHSAANIWSVATRQLTGTQTFNLTGNITGNLSGSVGSLTGHTAQTGDSYAIVNNASYGNAKLVRSTAPANALDVSATGEAGLDFNNIKNAGGAHTLTNITVPTVSALTGKTGFSLLSTGADLILKNSTFALAIADATWDEVLTGVTHNIANSSGRRVREIGAFAIHSGTAQAGNSHSITLAATADANDGIYNRNLIVLVDNTGVGQTRTIVDYDGTTKVAVIDRDFRVSPDATTTYQITPDDTPLVVDHGVAQAGTSTTITLRAYASAVNNNYLCNIVVIIAGTGRGQARLVGSYNGTTKVVTICGDNWVTTPDTTSVYTMIPYGTGCSSCMGATALSEINAEVDTALNTAIPGSPTADSINQRIKAMDDLTQASGSGDLAAILTNTSTTIPGTISTLQTDSTAIKAKTDNLPSGIAKNVALPKFDFYMVLSSDGRTAATGKTITGEISKDGGAFAGITNAITEVSNGMYKIASGFTQAEMNADVVTLKFTETDCDQRMITIYTT